MALRITAHKGKTTPAGVAYSARHLDRKFNLDKAPHIDQTRTHLNRYLKFEVDDNGELHYEKPKDIQAHELSVYEKLFKTRLKAINDRYIARRHKEKVRTLKQYYSSVQGCPDEYLIYIGNQDNHASSDILHDATLKLISKLQKKYPKNFIPLSASLHRDELGIGEDGEGAHIHFRCCWVCTDKDGLKVSITQGMKAAGVPLPKDDSAETRCNNRQMQFSQEIRDIFADICEQDYGLEIERVARDSSRAGKDLVTYQRDQALLDIQKLENTRSNICAEAALEAQKRDELAEEVAVLNKKKSLLETTLRGLEKSAEYLRKIVLPIQRFFERLAGIRLPKGRSALDELLLDSEITPAYDALKELQNMDER